MQKCMLSITNKGIYSNNPLSLQEYISHPTRDIPHNILILNEKKMTVENNNETTRPFKIFGNERSMTSLHNTEQLIK